MSSHATPTAAPERVPVTVLPDSKQVSKVVANEIAALIRSKAAQGKPCVLGLATAVLYLVMSVPLGYLSRHLEKRWGVK